MIKDKYPAAVSSVPSKGPEAGGKGKKDKKKGKTGECRLMVQPNLS